MLFVFSTFFFFNDTATTEIYTLSLHDALPIFRRDLGARPGPDAAGHACHAHRVRVAEDRKSTRLNSSHQIKSYAVICLKKKKSGRSCTPTGRKKKLRSSRTRDSC